MFRIDEYMDSLISVLKESFEKRLLYIGLQGSYLRHEEKQNSDIDIMAVVDGLSVTDLGIYREALISVGNYNKSCIISLVDLFAEKRSLKIGIL